MDTPVLISLINNAALLILLGVVYDLLGVRLESRARPAKQTLAGLVIGLIGIAVMLNPWQWSPGVIFDTRSVLLAVSGLFFGPAPTLTAVVVTSVFRLLQGGGGALTGVLSILLSSGAGLAWRAWRKEQLEQMPWWELYLLGIVTHILVLLGFFTFPWPLPLQVLPRLSLPFLLIHPLGVLLLGSLILHHIHRDNIKRDLALSQKRYRSLFEYAALPMIEEDFSAVLAYLKELQQRGVADLGAYLKQKPQALNECIRRARIVDINQRGRQFFGIRQGEMATVFARHFDPEAAEMFAEELTALAGGANEYSAEIPALMPDGNRRYLSLHVSVVPGDENKLERLLVSFADITEQKQAAAQIQAALSEKEALLRELYHRTKNNMQVIRSMLVLQSADSTIPEVHELVQETETKIQSMALVHQMLYESHNLSNIDLQLYIRQLAELVLSSYQSLHPNLRLRLELTSQLVTIDIATPLGLVLNELLSNTCKHAFPDQRPGEIYIALRREPDNWLRLEYTDNGVGPAPGFDPRRQTTYGLLSLFALSEGQLSGQVQVTSQPGLAYQITFPASTYQPRV